MATDAEIAGHLFMSTRNVQSLRSKAALPPTGSDLEANREAYILHMRETAGGRGKTPEKSDLDTQRARLAREQADSAALRNALVRKQTVPVAPISQAVIGMIEVAKTRLKRVPVKVAGSDAALKARIESAIEDALLDLSAERAVIISGDDNDGAEDE